jgi:hypothetical protein
VPEQVVTWGAKIHKDAGNMALSDGSTYQLNNLKLRNIFLSADRGTNFIAIP